jgi:hypothetical protein
MLGNTTGGVLSQTTVERKNGNARPTAVRSMTMRTTNAGTTRRRHIIAKAARIIIGPIKYATDRLLFNADTQKIAH